MDVKHLIVGGGVYGCFAALRLAELHGGANVAIVEREPDLLLRASYNNQARVHNGYHYPRSLLTALRSRVNAPRFRAEFADAICADFQQYYAIARRRSNVTSGQFEQFCRRIGADLKPAPAPVSRHFDPELIEAVFSVTEPAFDADRLRLCLWSRLGAAGVTVRLGTEALKVARCFGGGRMLVAELRSTGREEECACDYLYNCSYANLNGLLSRSGLGTIKLRHEATEMALVALPPALRDLSITVMCGPFFSLMPFPSSGLATLSHVSYTPHYRWSEDPCETPLPPHDPVFPLATRFDRMRRDAARYVPALREAAYAGSLWEVKTILPQSDASDSRPILFKRDPAVPNVISLLGSKIDNIFDLEDPLLAVHQHEHAAAAVY
jgi:glycine/D-amino acid oxidase-like deaminating enzyme